MALGDHTITMDVSGLDDLIESFQELSRQYPDASGDMLRKDGRLLRKEITKKAEELTDTDKGNRWSLAKEGSYSVSKPQGWGDNRYVEICAKAPHFHLVEHGHEKYDFHGNDTGEWVHGKHFLQKAVKEYREEMPRNVERMIDGVLKKEGFL